jgi:hypothetical protein
VWSGELPTPMNEYRKLHHHARADYDAHWRELFGWLARKEHVPPVPAVIITVHQTCRSASMPDPGSNFPTAKAAVDGLVDVGVIPDDSGRFVKFIGFTAPERGDENRFVLVVEEYLPTVERAS